jgi:hypothetical protein
LGEPARWAFVHIGTTVGGNAAGFSSLSPVAVPLRVKPQHIARGPAGGCGDDGAEVGLLDQRVEVDAPDEVIEVQPRQQAV